MYTVQLSDWYIPAGHSSNSSQGLQNLLALSSQATDSYVTPSTQGGLHGTHRLSVVLLPATKIVSSSRFDVVCKKIENTWLPVHSLWARLRHACALDAYQVPLATILAP
jgi:hypothetical protein